MWPNVQTFALLWTDEGTTILCHCNAFTHPLPPPGLACGMQELKLQSFNLQWFRDLDALFLSFGCFVFEILVRRSSAFIFECFVFETMVHKSVPRFLTHSGRWMSMCTLYVLYHLP